uniref:BACK domain-containing protein n=1 Tax=Glossina austeni TaxID=7395 RepID=A0A1A9VVJ6_GLOAU
MFYSNAMGDVRGGVGGECIEIGGWWERQQTASKVAVSYDMKLHVTKLLLSLRKQESFIKKASILKSQWNYISPMSTARRNFGICTYNDRIYVVGGNQISSVESYDPETNYGESETRLMRFDPREGRWNNLGKASRDRQVEFELLSYDYSLFRIGSKCERFDVRTHKWKPMPSMPSQLRQRATVMMSDDIYIIGGGKVERCNIHDNEWTIVDSTALEFCDGGAAVISDNSCFTE